jgi:hypothetical protein
MMDVPYAPGFATGVRWDDPSFNISWRLPVSVISERDKAIRTGRPEMRGRVLVTGATGFVGRFAVTSC